MRITITFAEQNSDTHKCDIGGRRAARGLQRGGSSDDAQSTAGGAPGLAEPAAPPEADAGAAPGKAAEGQDQAAEAPNLSVDQRSIVYTGSITVRVEDVNAAAARAIGFATAAGGFVGQDNRNSGEGSDNASLTLRVPAEKFSAVVDQLAGLGTEETRGISTEDVTEETIDLDARIVVQQARVDSGRRLLGQAKSLSDLVMLEREVATRESDLASLQAKKRRLADLTALSTITVVLLDPDAETAAERRPARLPGRSAGRLGRAAGLAGRAGHRDGRGAALADRARPADLGDPLRLPPLAPPPPGPERPARAPLAPAYAAAGNRRRPGTPPPPDPQPGPHRPSPHRPARARPKNSTGE